MIRILVLFFSISALASSRSNLEAYGDSLTAGYFSDTNVTASPSLSYVSTMISDLATYFVTGDAKILDKYEHRNLAWPAFVSRKFRGMRVENLAKPGSGASDLLRQVKLSSSGQGVVAYFFMGHNDIPEILDSKYTVATFWESYRKAILEWDRRHENSVAYILPIGDIPQVYEVLADVRWYQSPEGYHYGCRDSWERLFPYGRKYSMMQRRGELKKVVGHLIEEMNRTLEDEAAALLPPHSSNRVQYLHYPNEIEFRPEYFAVDCYHLSERGQQYVADTVLETIRYLGD